MKVKKGDKVRVISGKDRGKEGIVKLVLTAKDKVVVEGVSIAKMHKKNTGDQTKPKGIIEIERPIHVSNVMVIDTKSGKPARIGYEIKDGKKTRVFKSNTKKVTNKKK